jgi:hypothetical protein
MHNSIDYTMESMLVMCEGFERASHAIYLEYEAGLYIRLDTSSKMEMGAEMVAKYHEYVKPSYDEATWLEPTGSLWMTQLWEQDARNDIDYDNCSESDSETDGN